MDCLTKLLSKVYSLAIFLLAVAPIGRSQELGPILYKSWQGVCSISAETAATPRCSRSAFEDLSWQPHGSEIVAMGPGGLVLLDSKGHLLNRVEGQSGGRPTWSPDGLYIYAVSGQVGATVVRWNASGKNRVVIPVVGTNDPGPFLQMISLSPSGRRAAILTRDFKEMLIADVSDRALSVKKTLPRGFLYVAQSVWLDDEHLLFVGMQDSSRGELWELDVRSGTTTRRGVNGLWLRDFVALSPDGKSVVLTATKDGAEVSWDLWQFFPESLGVIRLTSGTAHEDVEPSWRH